MTPRTHLVAVVPQHGQTVRSMDLMALAAGIDGRMPMQAPGGTGKSILVAGLANLVARSFQHLLVVRGMRAVAQNAPVFHPGEHMIMRGHHAGLHSCVTPQTGIASVFLLGAMAGIAFFLGKRLMQMVPDKPLARASMGIMTGKTPAQFAWEPTVPSTALRLLMTGQAQGIGFHLKKLTVFCLMGLMTDRTLSLGKRLMAHGLGFCQFLMADKTCFSQALPEQTVMPGSVGGMAAKAFPVADRLVHHPLGKLCFRTLVARVTKLRALALQQSGIFRHMRVMTISALALGHRAMGEFAGEILPFVALVANLIGQRDRTGKPGGQADYQ